MEVKYKEYKGTLLAMEKEFCYKTMAGDEYNTVSLKIQTASNVIVEIAGANEKDIVLESAQLNFWKSANEPHQKEREFCLISWETKSKDNFMVDVAWWWDGKWTGTAEFNPPDFYAPIPSPEANKNG